MFRIKCYAVPIKMIFMMESTQSDRHKAMQCAVQIVSSWIATTKCDVDDLRTNLLSVYDTILSCILKDMSHSSSLILNGDVSSTFTKDYIVCLEDGKKLKMLKRHLRSKYNMSIEIYKSKWGLPHNYPSVAENYAKKRSAIAKRIRSKGTATKGANK